jgi:uncharacterized protein (TIGR03067 family)
MRWILTVVGGAGLLLGTALAQDEKGMEGTWTMVSGIEKGKKLPAETVKTARLTIKGDQHTVELDGEILKGKHTVDATKKPKTIDSNDTEGPFKGKTLLGIFEVDGDQFKVAFAAPGKERPKDFTSADIVHVWQRQKK